MKSPLVLITLGDVAGIGPEIVAKAWPQLCPVARPVVIGACAPLEAALTLVNSPVKVRIITDLAEAAPDCDTMPVLVGSARNLEAVPVGAVSAEAGGAACDFLVRAIELTLAGEAAAIATCPLHKEGLRAAGIPFPGHTEILAARTNSPTHAMLLFDAELPLAVAHVTLHQSLRSAVNAITMETVLEKIQLLDSLLPHLTGHPARIGVAALNPHSSDGGLFGDEEQSIILPAVEAANAAGIVASGPYPADAIFLPHIRTQFDGVVVMYHDQGHIPMKLLGGRRAVNITAGLPIIRTSVAHGTAYDIAGRGVADESSLVSAVAIAAKLARSRGGPSRSALP